MTAAQFVTNWRREKDELLKYFMGEYGETVIAGKINAMSLSREQLAQFRGVLDDVLHETMYTLLLGLDGATSIGMQRQRYHIADEHGNVVTGGGDLEAEAWAKFQGT